MDISCKSFGHTVVAWAKGTFQAAYRDKYLILSQPQDGTAIHPPSVFGVFDGIGPTRLGFEAACSMCRTMENAYLAGPDAFHLDGLRNVLRLDAAAADNSPFNHHKGRYSGSLAWIDDQHINVFHSGSTTALLCKGNNSFVQLTQSVSEYDQISYPAKNVPYPASFQEHSCSHQDADLLILASDGLTAVLESHHIGLLAVSPETLPEVAVNLVRCAQNGGSWDDITVVIVDLKQFQAM